MLHVHVRVEHIAKGTISF